MYCCWQQTWHATVWRLHCPFDSAWVHVGTYWLNVSDHSTLVAEDQIEIPVRHQNILNWRLPSVAFEHWQQCSCDICRRCPCDDVSSTSLIFVTLVGKDRTFSHYASYLPLLPACRYFRGMLSFTFLIIITLVVLDRVGIPLRHEQYPGYEGSRCEVHHLSLSSIDSDVARSVRWMRSGFIWDIYWRKLWSHHHKNITCSTLGLVVKSELPIFDGYGLQSVSELLGPRVRFPEGAPHRPIEGVNILWLCHFWFTFSNLEGHIL